MKPTNNTTFYKQIIDLLQAARNNIVRAVNQTMVLTYFEIGRIIIEEEQKVKIGQNMGKNF